MSQLGESRDLADERDSELYQAMLEQVREEWAPEYEPFEPDGRAVHAEAMRRLRKDSKE